MIGVDPSPEMLGFARRLTSLGRMDGVEFLQGSVAETSDAVSVAAAG